MISYTLKSFIDHELKTFSNLDNVRSIPSIIDGFKDAQRKAVFGALDKGNEKIKVAQLAGHCALITKYQHGEGAMSDTIVGMAQSFPGSNNANMFEPIGQFGSILSDEASSPRYIYTKPSKFLRQYLKRDDDAVLEHRTEEGHTLEPLHYLPIIPLWLVNGSVGIGTGHSCKMLPRDPKKVKTLIKMMLQGKATPENAQDYLVPHFNGWKGTVVKGDSLSQWELHGVMQIVNTTTIRITELPVTYGVDKYKEILISLMDEGIIKDYDNNSNEDSFDFVVTVPRETGRKSLPELMKIFKLIVKFGENVTMWNVENKLKRYPSVYDALVEFLEYRLKKYQVRKEVMLKANSAELYWTVNKMHFIRYWNESMREPHKKTKQQLLDELKDIINLDFADRLLSLQISSLTMEKVKELEQEAERLQQNAATLLNTTTDEFYLTDLKDL
jgi:DNA topoisomerase-2